MHDCTRVCALGHTNTNTNTNTHLLMLMSSHMCRCKKVLATELKGSLLGVPPERRNITSIRRISESHGAPGIPILGEAAHLEATPSVPNQSSCHGAVTFEEVFLKCTPTHNRTVCVDRNTRAHMQARSDTQMCIEILFLQADTCSTAMSELR